MRINIIDKCCNEYKTLIIEQSEIAKIISNSRVFEITPAKKGHSIIVHPGMTPDMVIEYMPSEQPHSF